MLEILDAAPKDSPFFFQLYINKERRKTEELLRVVNSRPQIKALFVTVDLPVVSKREADERLKMETLYSSGVSGSQTFSDSKGSGMARTVGSFIDPSFCWDDLAWVRKQTKLPIVLKGIQSASDARTAMHLGCQGIVVSNHGGRALDGAPASILVLLELHRECPEVFEHMEVFIDGGFRRGSDILKALCLGASGVGLGRPFMYAVNYGKDGVVHLINSKYYILSSGFSVSPREQSFLVPKETQLAIHDPDPRSCESRSTDKPHHSSERRSRNGHAPRGPDEPRRRRSEHAQHGRTGPSGPSRIDASVRTEACRWAARVSIVKELFNRRLPRRRDETRREETLTATTTTRWDTSLRPSHSSRRNQSENEPPYAAHTNVQSLTETERRNFPIFLRLFSFIPLLPFCYISRECESMSTRLSAPPFRVVDMRMNRVFLLSHFSLPVTCPPVFPIVRSWSESV